MPVSHKKDTRLIWIKLPQSKFSIISMPISLLDTDRRILFIFLEILTGVAGFPEKRQKQGNPCITACPLYIVKFCGSDGKTYTSNPCFVKDQMCR